MARQRQAPAPQAGGPTCRCTVEACTAAKACLKSSKLKASLGMSKGYLGEQQGRHAELCAGSTRLYKTTDLC